MAGHGHIVSPFAATMVTWDLRLVVVVATALAVLATYLTTSLQSRLLRGTKGEPPPVPYWVPFVGNTASFALNTERYIKGLLKRLGTGPFTLSVAGAKMYYIPQGEAVVEYFKKSRDLDGNAMNLVGLHSFGCPPDDIKRFGADASGGHVRPAPGFEHLDNKDRIWYTQHRDFHSLLTGASLDAMTTKFVEVFSRRVKTTSRVRGTEWIEMPDFYTFLRDELFCATTQALCGDHFFEVNPDFNDLFWDMDRGMLPILRRLPRWMAAKSYGDRDRALAAVAEWHRVSNERFDWDDKEQVAADWEPVFGARLMRARQRMFKDLGTSTRSHASMDLGMMWATSANAIPATLWALWGILVSPSLTKRVAAQIEPCWDRSTGQINIAALCATPLLTSIYLEALRFCVATTTARSPTHANVKFGGYALKQNGTLLSISWFGQRDESFWNAGPGDRHPPTEFWAERFLEYPGDGTSGPIRRPDVATAGKDAQETEKTVEDDKEAKVVTAGIGGHWYPYGGGAKMCPGRFFAKQEMMVAVAIMLNEFEIEPVDAVEARKAVPDMRVFLVGALPPDRKIAMRIRRRRA